MSARSLLGPIAHQPTERRVAALSHAIPKRPSWKPCANPAAPAGTARACRCG
jgi:hypothetical protein